MNNIRSGLKIITEFITRSSGNDRNAHLQKAIDELTLLNTSMETKFLSLGKKLNDYYLQTKEISNDSSSIACMISGKEITNVTEGLEEISTWVKQLNGKSDNGIKVLTSTLQRVDNMKNQLGYFYKIIRNLYILCHFIKIETTHFKDNEEFSALAKDINRLADDIDVKLDQLLHQNDSLKLLIQQNLTLINDFKIKQESQAGLILGKSMEKLASLSRRHNLSADILKKLSEKWENISQSTGEVVTSIQFHDITRQQIEHSIEAFKGLICRNHNIKQNASTNNFFSYSAGNLIEKYFSNYQKTPNIIAPVCKLQMAQIRNAGNQLFTAVTNIINNLKFISEQTEELSAEAINVTGNNEQGKESFLSAMEKDLYLLSDSLAEYTELNKQIEATMFKLSDTVGAMSSFVSEIEKIGIDMKIVALNTIIHAAHIGEEGLSLSVLAEAVHQLSVETSANIKVVVENLNAFISISDKLAQNAQIDSKEKWKSKDLMIDYMQNLIKPIRKSDENTLDILSRINYSAISLRNEIEKTIKTINIHFQMMDEIDSVNSILSPLTDDTSNFDQKDFKKEQIEELQELTQNYTMSGEREIHESMAFLSDADESGACKIAGMIAGSKTEASYNPETEFGDNVELF